MKCTYTYKGNLIGDDIQLADFICEKLPLMDQIGDVVFEMNATGANNISLIQGAVTEAGKKAKEESRQYYENRTVEYADDGTMNIEEKPPVMGVNAFIAAFRTEDGSVITPEFRGEEYWNRRLSAWKPKTIAGNTNPGVFTEDETQIINEYLAVSDPGTTLDPGQTYSDETYNKWKDVIEQKWKQQGQIGTALHSVSEWLFSKVGDKYVFEEESINPDYAKLQYERWKSDYLSIYDHSIKKGDLITEAQFLEMVKMLQDFRVNLQQKFGAKARFFAEMDIAGDINEYNGCHTLHGIIDLLVVDENGYVHIVDYKTSPKSYDQYASAKKRAFTLQLGTYQRILRKFGVNTQGGQCIIVPITLKGFHLDNTRETDPKNLKYTYDGLSYKQNDLSEGSPVIQQVLTEVNSENISDTLDKFIPQANRVSATSSNLIEKITKQMAIWFPNHLTDRNMTEEQISEKLKEEKAFEPTALGTLEYKTPYSDDPIVVPINNNLDFAKVQLVKKVQEQLRSINDRNIQRVNAFIDSFNEAVKSGLPFDYRYTSFKDSGFDKTNLENLMKPYCKGNYEVIDLPTAKNFGIVVLQNISTKACVAFKIVNGDLHYNYKFSEGRTNLNGSFAKDIEESSNANSLILKANRGNIEGMEAMLVLNNLDWVGTPQFESINVLNPSTQRLMPIYNSEYLYNWKALTKHSLLEEDKFSSGKVQLLSQLDYFRLKINEIVNSGAPEYNSIKRELTSAGFDWQGETNPLKVKTELENLMQFINRLYPNRTTTVARDSSSLADPIIQLYNQAAIAYNDINGVIMRQQTKDSDKWLQTVRRILREGAEGLNLENPGNFSSQLLNTVSISVKNVNQKVREIILRQSYEVSKYVKKLKQAVGFNTLQEYVSNQTSLYMDMTEVTPDGDFVFVNPDTLTGAKRKFLEYVLDTINKDRWPSDHANLELWKNSNDRRYYRVPLLAASTGSKLKTNNLLGSLRAIVQDISPKNALANTMDAIASTSEEIQQTNNDIYRASVVFDAGNDEQTRMRMLRKYGANAYEHNLETLLLNHSYQYARKNAFDSELIKMKACAIAMAHQGNFVNPTDRENFKDTLDYLDNIVKVQVHNQNLSNSKVAKLVRLTGRARSVASLLALGFSPVQWTYQRIDGIWKNLGLVIKKPDGTDAFTSKHMFDSAKHVETELFHSHLTPTVLSRINELYGINDMDADQFANRLSSDKGWFTHVYDLAFRFTSRPDYYNRMTIFEAQMRKDGSFEAHTLNNGELIYDFSKDSRYKDYASAKKEGKQLSQFTEQERESYARYFAAAKEFINEGVVNPDGTLFKLGDDLPKAYSNRESQSMKSIADNVYGYYNKEDKSLIHYMFLGGLYMQMKTYWSAKKNQYLAPGGTKLLGKFVDYQENGKQLYYAKDENGEIDLSKGFVTIDDPNCSKVKVRRWEGQHQEGILLTLAHFYDSAKEGGVHGAWQELWNNPNDNLRTCYRSNFKHLAIDMFMWLVVGHLVALLLGKWDDDEKKEFNKDKNMGNAVNYISSHFIYQTVTRSFQDFNFISSIGEPLIEWRPYSFGALKNIVEDGFDVFTGDKTLLNATSENIAAIRTIKPALQAIRES